MKCNECYYRAYCRKEKIENGSSECEELVSEYKEMWGEYMGVYPLVECPFEGCDQLIDVGPELADAILTGAGGERPVRIQWFHHSVVCPNCKNAVCSINYGPSPWYTIGEDKYAIRDPTTGRSIEVGKDKRDMDPYLKDWAKIGPLVEELKKEKEDREGGE